MCMHIRKLNRIQSREMKNQILAILTGIYTCRWTWNKSTALAYALSWTSTRIYFVSKLFMGYCFMSSQIPFAIKEGESFGRNVAGTVDSCFKVGSIICFIHFKVWAFKAVACYWKCSILITACFNSSQIVVFLFLLVFLSYPSLSIILSLSDTHCTPHCLSVFTVVLLCFSVFCSLSFSLVSVFLSLIHSLSVSLTLALSVCVDLYLFWSLLVTLSASPSFSHTHKPSSSP